MGCCISTPRDDSGPAVRAHSSSHHIITAASSTRASTPSGRASHVSQGIADPARSRPDANERPNSPLKPIAADQRSQLPNSLASATASNRGRVKPLTGSTNLTWTRPRLDKERGDWWDTQVTGSPEIWGAVRLATQYLQAGELQEAQTMLDVTGCTCPTGLLWRGVYDSTGIQYSVPEWVVVEPGGLAEGRAGEHEAAVGSTSAVLAVDGANDSSDSGGSDTVLIRARMSFNHRDVSIRIRRNEPIASVVEKLKKQADLAPYSKVRLAYGGHLYKDYETLGSHPHWNFANDYVLTALVTL